MKSPVIYWIGAMYNRQIYTGYFMDGAKRVYFTCPYMPEKYPKAFKRAVEAAKSRYYASQGKIYFRPLIVDEPISALQQVLMEAKQKFLERR